MTLTFGAEPTPEQRFETAFTVFAATMVGETQTLILNAIATRKASLEGMWAAESARADRLFDGLLQSATSAIRELRLYDPCLTSDNSIQEILNPAIRKLAEDISYASTPRTPSIEPENLLAELLDKKDDLGSAFTNLASMVQNTTGLTFSNIPDLERQIAQGAREKVKGTLISCIVQALATRRSEQQEALAFLDFYRVFRTYNGRVGLRRSS